MVSPGFIVTYTTPLAFVLFVTMGKEAIQRHRRDREANSQQYLTLTPTSTDLEQEFLDSRADTCSVSSSSLRIGDFLLEKDQRVAPTGFGLSLSKCI